MEPLHLADYSSFWSHQGCAITQAPACSQPGREAAPRLCPGAKRSAAVRAVHQAPATSRQPHAASLPCPQLQDQANISQPARNAALRPWEVPQLVILLGGARRSVVISLGKLPSTHWYCCINPGSDGGPGPTVLPLPRCSEDGSEPVTNSSDPTYCKTATSSVSRHVSCFAAPKGCSRGLGRASGGG